MVDHNATQAAIRAGYSEHTAYSIGHELLKQPEVINEITRLTREFNERYEAERDDVIERLTMIALGDFRGLFREDGVTFKLPHELDPVTASLIVGFEAKVQKVPGGGPDEIERIVKYKLTDRLASVKALGEHFNIFKEHEKAGAGELHLHFDAEDRNA